MFANGMFYGIDQSTVAQDILASFMISLVGTAPQLIIRLLFKNAKPRDNSSAKSPKASLTLTFRSAELPEINEKEAEDSSSKSCQLDAIRKKSKLPDSELAKIEEAAQMRKEMYKGMYPLPPCVRDIAWVLLLLVSAIACCAAVCCLFIAFHERHVLKSRCPYVQIIYGLAVELIYNMLFQ